MTKALAPSFIEKFESPWIGEAVSVATGIALISLLAQLSIPLPFTPVPVTGQTFGVALVSLIWGSRRAVPITLSYLALGAAGLPLFAGGSSGALLGPTAGYLVGMLFASIIVGRLADRGFGRRWWSAMLACACGSACVFACGLAGLSFYVPAEKLLALGLWPFLPGDVLKSTLASFLSSQLSRSQK